MAGDCGIAWVGRAVPAFFFETARWEAVKFVAHKKAGTARPTAWPGATLPHTMATPAFLFGKRLSLTSAPGATTIRDVVSASVPADGVHRFRAGPTAAADPDELTMSIITLITDYGTQDHYAAVLKGVIAGIAPAARVIDATHAIAPHHVLYGAFVLGQILPWYPPGTIHLAVVDPGVGSNRRILVGKYAGQYVIAPDNGLMTLLHRETRPEALHVVENERFFLPALSSTFHGRDIMAPVAAHLFNGVGMHEFGRATDQLEMLSVPHRAQIKEGVMHGIVLYVDRFGTLVTNVHREQLVATGGVESAGDVRVNGTRLGGIRSTFSDVPVGEPLALIGGCGFLEIAVNQGSAVEKFGAADGLRIEVRCVASG